MYVMIIIFIVAALLIGLFCVFVVGRDVVNEEKEKRKKRNAAVQEQQTIEAAIAEPEAPTAEQTATATADPETQTEEVATAEPEIQTVELTENTIAFSTASSTLDERYLELTAEHRGYYDEIVRYAMAVEGSKRYKNANTEEYKVGRNSLVKIKIRRGVIICELVIPNLTFKNYINDNKLAVRQAPAVIKVTDEASLSAVKDSIAIAVKAIEEEKAYKKEQAKLRRRKNNAAARSLSDGTAE